MLGISKFNYLVKLVEGKPKESMLDLRHSMRGYEEKQNEILKEICGQDIKVHKVLILQDIHEFYNRFVRVIKTTMGETATSQAHSYTIFNKLGPVKKY